MQKHFFKFSKVFTNIACSHLILISNNSELAAKYLPNNFEETTQNSETNNINYGLSREVDSKQINNFFLAENKKNTKKESVLISDIIIE